jgi:hypothetical protein
MIESMNKKYTDGKVTCYDMSDGSKVCAHEQAWGVFYGMMKKKGKDETKSLSEDNIEVSDLENVEDAINILNEEIDNDFSYGVQVQKLSDKTIIRGVLLAEGIWKGFKYDYNVIKQSAPKFLSDNEYEVDGKKYIPIAGDVDHKRTLKYKDKIVGKLTKVVPNDMLKCLMFEAEITDQEAREDVLNGSLNAVSPTGRFTDDGNYQPLGWALTGTPACHFSTIFNYDLSLLDEEQATTSTESLNNKVTISNTDEGDNVIMSVNQTVTTEATGNVAKAESIPETKQEQPKQEQVKVEQTSESVKETPKEESQLESKDDTVKEEDKPKDKVESVQVIDEEKLINSIVSKLKEEFNKNKQEPVATIVTTPAPKAEPIKLVPSAELAAELLVNPDSPNLTRFKKPNKQGEKQ